MRKWSKYHYKDRAKKLPHKAIFEGEICCDDNSTTITCKKLRQATKKMKARSEKEGVKKINELKVLRQDMKIDIV